ncbi:hypothetical protein Tcan_13888 [Toxocara canis]|uniref:G_PROTEIN_RECEP_F1_2 domain-containing protein n=1 Tax=Toxocara canis TaxID=6265 RepID=A0A0B2V1U3_TOXCA|nr:hypothetical protein Tcan_13888 [Toxocara canis]
MNTRKFVVSQLLVVHFVALTVFITSVVVALFSNNSTSTLQCRQSSYLPEKLFTMLSCLRVIASVSSILVMGVVIARLGSLVEDRKFVDDARLLAFKRGQREFTRIMILSCVVTLVLDIIPNCLSAYAHLSHLPNIDNHTTFARFFTYFNAMNLVVATAVRQKEIRDEVWLRMGNFLRVIFCRKN